MPNAPTPPGLRPVQPVESPPQNPNPSPAETVANAAGVEDWQAAIAVYVICMLIAESETWGPVSAALAWAIATIMLLDLVSNFKNLKPVAPAGSNSGALVSSGAGPNDPNPNRNVA